MAGRALGPVVAGRALRVLAVVAQEREPVLYKPGRALGRALAAVVRSRVLVLHRQALHKPGLVRYRPVLAPSAG